MRIGSGAFLSCLLVVACAAQARQVKTAGSASGTRQKAVHAASEAGEAKLLETAEDAAFRLQYLEAEELLRPLALSPRGASDDGSLHQTWAEIMASMTGETPVEPSPNSADPGALTAIAEADPRDAIQEIVKRAGATSIVFLNEAHGVPRSRAFGLQVAEALRPLGYSVLAVETLDNSGGQGAADARLARMAKDGYVRPTDGYYVRDPVFADFLRQAIRLGYQPESYEQTPQEREGDPELSVAKREQAQADHLLNRVLDRHPGSKLLVYVGFSHAAEEPQVRHGGGDIRWLASRIKAMTGIDPLTIDQTILMQDSASEDASPLARAAAAKATQGRSIVLTHDGAPVVVGQYAGLVDLQVAHPIVARQSGRPGWLASAMHRRSVPIPATLLPISGKRLIQAFVASEGPNTVPVDQVLVKAGAEPPAMLLPDVPVRWAVQSWPSAAAVPAAASLASAAASHPGTSASPSASTRRSSTMRPSSG